MIYLWKFNSILFSILLCVSCTGQVEPKSISSKSNIDEFYTLNEGDNTSSVSIGSVSNGKLENGKLIPFSGSNFQYFDTTSYLNGRAYVNDCVLKAVTEAYNSLEELAPNRKFIIMECSNRKGGKLFPHRTHQNGLSIDFMMPLIKNEKPEYSLDYLGANHYGLDFDNTGSYTEDKDISIDFNLVARHILELEKYAKTNHLRIKKVIINTELKSELFSTKAGEKLKESGIYLVQKLTPLINSLHDDHYHVGFEVY